MLEVPVQRHRFLATSIRVRIACSNLTLLKLQTIKFSFSYVEASYEIYENLHDLNISHYMVYA